MLLTKDIRKTIVQNKAKKLLKDIEDKINKGEISLESQLINELNSAYDSIINTNLNTTVVVPDFRPGELPMRSMIEDPLFAAENDIIIGWDQINNIREKLKNLYNLQRSEVQGLINLIGTVQNKTSVFQLFTSDSENNFLWSSDSFVSLEKINQSETTAFIDTVAGVALNKVLSLSSLNGNIIELKIDKQACIGLPGTNMLISKELGISNPDQNPEPQVELEGAIDLHSNISYIFDGNSDTWLDWESIYIPKIQKVKKIGTAYISDTSGEDKDVDKITGEKGWGWRKFVQWPGESEWDRGLNGLGFPIADFINRNIAKLVFTIKLNSIQKISTIKIVPRIVGGVYPIVRAILVSNDGEHWAEVAKDVFLTEKLNESLSSSKAGVPEGNYAGVGIWNVEHEGIQFIKFSIESSGFYIPNIGLGHQFYFKVEQFRKEQHFLFVTEVRHWTEETRLPNPDQGIAAGNSSGVAVDGKTLGTAIGAGLGSIVPGVGTLLGGAIGNVIGGLFGGKTDSTILRQGSAYDIFYGERSPISIRDIDISIRQYDTESQIVSVGHFFSQPLDSVSIISTENIPNQWDHSQEWIQFFVSKNGHDWTYIIPQNRSKGKNDVVFVNGTQIVYVKIVLKRPSSKPQESASLLNYAIKALPKV